MNETIIKKGFESLNNHDLVIGPATDGGYYLLGKIKFQPSFFENIDWSTDKVLRQTIGIADRLNLPAFLPPELSDIDREKDVQIHRDLLIRNQLYSALLSRHTVRKQASKKQFNL